MPNSLLTGALLGSANRLGEQTQRRRSLEDEQRQLAQSEAARQQALLNQIRLMIAQGGGDLSGVGDVSSGLNVVSGLAQDRQSQAAETQTLQTVLPFILKSIEGGYDLDLGGLDIGGLASPGVLSLASQLSESVGAERRREAELSEEERQREIKKYNLEIRDLESKIANRGKEGKDTEADRLRLEELGLRIEKLRNDISNPPLKEAPGSILDAAEEAKRSVLVGYIERIPKSEPMRIGTEKFGFDLGGGESSDLSNRVRLMIDGGAKTSDIEQTIMSNLPKSEADALRAELDQAAQAAIQRQSEMLRGVRTTGNGSDFRGGEFRALPASVIAKIEEFPPQYQQQILQNVQAAYADRSITEEELLNNLSIDLDRVRQRGE